MVERMVRSGHFERESLLVRDSLLPPRYHVMSPERCSQALAAAVVSPQCVLLLRSIVDLCWRDIEADRRGAKRVSLAERLLQQGGEEAASAPERVSLAELRATLASLTRAQMVELWYTRARQFGIIKRKRLALQEQYARFLCGKTIDVLAPRPRAKE